MLINKFSHTVFIFFISVYVVFGQVSTYEFNNSLDDGSHGHDASYLVDGKMSTSSPNYRSTDEATILFLEATEGIFLPKSLVKEIDTSQSLEISFSFVIDDIGSGSGYKDLWNCQEQVNEPGLGLFVQHDEFSEKRDFAIYFAHSDGGFNKGVPDHIGHDKTIIGRGLEGNVIDVRLVMDFQSKTWSSVVDGEFVSNSFNTTDLNWDKVLSSLKENSWYFAWHKGQEADMQFSPNRFTSSLSIDYLHVHSPRQDGNTDLLKSALQNMTAFVQSTLDLTYEERLDNLNQIFFNYHNNFGQVKEEIYAYMEAYEAVFPPVYEDRMNIAFASMSPEAQLLVFLQQSLFDTEVVPDNVKNMEGVVFEFSNIFPGPVKDNAKRINNASVKANGSYSYDPAGRIVADLEAAKRPLGYYAPPGEIVTIDIPKELINSNLSILVGAHDSDLSSRPVRNRFNRMSKVFPLEKLSTQVINPFGGGLYLLVPEGSALGWIDISISGAVKSPYFSWRKEDKTELSNWTAELKTNSVQWVDLESESFMMTMPLSHMKSVNDPSKLMEIWDEIIAGYQYVGGRPNSVSRALYFAVDSRIPADAFGTGYPQIIGDEQSPFGPLSSYEYLPTHVLEPTFWDSDINTTFHEYGHAALHPTLITEVETVVHIPATYVYNTIFNLTFDEAFKYSSQEFLLLHEAAMDWMIADNFRNNKDMDCDPTMDELVCDELRYQHRGHAKYIDMARLFGWEALFNMNFEFYKKFEITPPLHNNVSKEDVIRNASVSNGVNMSPLFHFWGLAPSESLRQELSTLPQSQEILELLKKYYNYIPETQADFQEYRDKLLDRKDPVHHKRINDAYEKYESEGYAESMKNQICNIVTLYYSVDKCDLLSSVKEPKALEREYAISSNPSTGQIEVLTSQQGYSIQIYNQQGKKCYQASGQKGNRFFDLGFLPDGIYFVKFYSSTNKYTERQKLIIIR